MCSLYLLQHLVGNRELCTGRRSGAQLDGELLSTPLAADFGPFLEAAGGTAGRRCLFPIFSMPLAADFRPDTEVGRRATGRGNSLSTPLAIDFGPGPDGAAGGAQLDAEFAFHAPRHQLWAWPGWGGGGVRCLGVELAFLSFSHWPLDRRPSYARSLLPIPSKTVDRSLYGAFTV